MKGGGERIFVTGATGYIGGRLVPRLLDDGYRVVCASRSLAKLRSRPWSTRPNQPGDEKVRSPNASGASPARMGRQRIEPLGGSVRSSEGDPCERGRGRARELGTARMHDLELVEADVSDTEKMAEAMRGCRAAYYLVHSMMAAGEEYAAVDRRLAHGFAEAAERAGVSLIIYLGGLGETGAGLSEHLGSRREVESALASTTVAVTTLRAAMIIGSGSASFEILRYLVERLPLMVTPKWVSTECQPVAVSDVLFSLVAVLKHAEAAGRTFDLGGADVMTYREIMQTTAEALGLRRRLIVPVPVLTPRLSSLWIHLVTPLSHRIARPLAEGLRNRVVARNDDIQRLTGHRFLGVRASIDEAMAMEEGRRVATAWSDAGVMPGDPDWAGGTTLSDVRAESVDAPPAVAFRAVRRIGGRRGYYGSDRLWWLRGLLDRLVGGPGLRRGRRDPEHLAYGDAVDFWRVTAVEPDRRLELRAEMKLPGVAGLEFTIEPAEGGSVVTQTARFQPRGLSGILYWYSVSPLHGLVFRSMLKGVKREAERLAKSGRDTAIGGMRA